MVTVLDTDFSSFTSVLVNNMLCASLIRCSNQHVMLSVLVSFITYRRLFTYFTLLGITGLIQHWGLYLYGNESEPRNIFGVSGFSYKTTDFTVSYSMHSHSYLPNPVTISICKIKLNITVIINSHS